MTTIPTRRRRSVFFRVVEFQIPAHMSVAITATTVASDSARRMAIEERSVTVNQKRFMKRSVGIRFHRVMTPMITTGPKKRPRAFG